MASVFEAQFGDLALPVLLGQFGETVTYTPYGSAAVSISAIVLRGPRTVQGPNQAQVAYLMAVRVSRDDVPTVTCGRDTVAAKQQPNDAAAKTYRVLEILNTYGNAWELGLSGAV